MRRFIILLLVILLISLASVNARPFINITTFNPFNGTIETNGAEINDNFSINKIKSKNCAEGTCNESNSWQVGFMNASAANTKIILDFNLSNLLVNGSAIHNFTLFGSGCWSGDFSSLNCNGSDDPEFLAGTSPQMQMEVYRWDLGLWQGFDIGYNITNGSNWKAGPGANYTAYNRTKNSGFVSGHLNNGVLRVRYNITGKMAQFSDDLEGDAVGVYDWISLNVTYYLPPLIGAKTCVLDGSASATKVLCNASLGSKEDYTNATIDICADRGFGTPQGYVEDIALSSALVNRDDTITATCRMYCSSTNKVYSILYNNGTGWRNKAFGNCSSSGFNDVSTTFAVDNVSGTHYVRCWENDYFAGSCGISDTCCSAGSGWSDNDDISFVVHTECGTITSSTNLTKDLTTTGTCFTIGNSFLTLDGAGYSITSNESGTGIDNFFGYDQITIQNFRGINNFSTGISLVGTRYSFIFNNTITAANTTSGYGITLVGSQDNTISSNKIITYGQVAYGIALGESTNRTQVLGNNITTFGSSAGGIVENDNKTQDNLFKSNLVNSFWVGIGIAGTGNTLVENNITSSLYSIYLNSFGGNNLVNNQLIAGLNAVVDYSGNDTINYLIYNNSYGEIKWTNTSNLSFLDHMTINGSIGLGINLFIGPNVTALNTSAFGSESKINSTINITMKDQFWNSTVIKKLESYNTNYNQIRMNGQNCVNQSCSIFSHNISTGILKFMSDSLGSFSLEE